MPIGLKKLSTLAPVALVAFFIGCGDDDTQLTGELPDNASDVVATYSKIVLASYRDSLEAAKELDEALADFLDSPDKKGLEAAREAWLAAREPYLQTETFRFYNGPIDNPDDGPEGFINSWPLDEAYIDYVKGDKSAGLINDSSVNIDEQELLAANQDGGEENVATGYHAIEFLLWGQDFSDDGPGDRPFTDYVEGDDGTAENADRRAAYLTTASAMLVADLEELVDAWKSGGDNYRKDFEKADPTLALSRILTGMHTLSGFETGGERLQPALDSGDQEDEHSCFSDNTHRDMVQDVQGVLNVWQGSYQKLDGGKVSGPSLFELVEQVDAKLADDTDAQIKDSLKLAEALKPPFDQEIDAGNKAGNARVEALIEALVAQEKLLKKVIDALGLSVVETE